MSIPGCSRGSASLLALPGVVSASATACWPKKGRETRRATTSNAHHTEKRREATPYCSLLSCVAQFPTHCLSKDFY